MPSGKLDVIYIYLVSVVPVGDGKSIVKSGLANMILWASMPTISLPKVGLFHVARRVLEVDPNVLFPRIVNEDGRGERSAR